MRLVLILSLSQRLRKKERLGRHRGMWRLIQPLRVEDALRRYGVNCCEGEILCYRQQAGYAVDFVERRKKRVLTFS